MLKLRTRAKTALTVRNKAPCHRSPFCRIRRPNRLSVNSGRGARGRHLGEVLGRGRHTGAAPAGRRPFPGAKPTGRRAFPGAAPTSHALAHTMCSRTLTKKRVFVGLLLHICPSTRKHRHQELRRAHRPHFGATPTGHFPAQHPPATHWPTQCAAELSQKNAILSDFCCTFVPQPENTGARNSGEPAARIAAQHPPAAAHIPAQHPPVISRRSTHQSYPGAAPTSHALAHTMCSRTLTKKRDFVGLLLHICPSTRKHRRRVPFLNRRGFYF